MKKNIIFIASYPKSGNTWIRILISSLLDNLVKLNENSLKKFEFNDLEKINMFSQLAYFREIKGCILKEDGVLNENFAINNWINAQKLINQTSSKTKFFKTHNIRGKINGKNFTDETVCAGFIYIYRDPRDIAISKAKYMNTNIDVSIDRMLNDEKVITCPTKVIEYVNTWENHVTSWYGFNTVPRLMIKYEDMLKDTKKIITQLIEFINTISTFKIDKNNRIIDHVFENTQFNNLKELEDRQGFKESLPHSNFFRKGTSGQWKDILNKKQINLIEKKLKIPMQYLGYL